MFANISSVCLTDLTKSVKNNSHVLKVMMMILIMGLDEIAESVIISVWKNAIDSINWGKYFYIVSNFV